MKSPVRRFIKLLYLNFKYLVTRFKVTFHLNKNKKIFIELGSGNKKGGNGWLTIDNTIKCDLSWDLNKGIPFPNESISKIY